jgi:hypothetical protein
MKNQDKKTTVTAKPEKSKQPTMAAKPSSTTKNAPQKAPKR